jgi:hypothetical protein
MKKTLAVFAFVALILPNFAGAVYNPTGGGTYRLQTSVGTADTSIRLSSFKEPVSNFPYTMAYLNSSLQCGTLDPQTTRSEFISFTGITQNSDGTAILTGVSRGLERSYPYTASSTFRQTHAGQSIFILSDAPCLFNQYGIKQNDENVTGYWDFPTPLSDDNAATKAYVDALVNGGTVSNARIVVPGLAGEIVSAGQILSLRKSDGEWYLADNDTPLYQVDSLIGIAQGAGTNGNAITGGVLLQGLDTNQSGLTAGQRYFLSSTAGGLTTSTTTTMVGQARNTTDLYVDFQQANPYYFGGVGYTFPTAQGSNGTSLINNGSGVLTWSSVNGLLAASSSPISVSGSTASTTLLTATVPANSLNASSTIRVQLKGFGGLFGDANAVIYLEAGYGTATTSTQVRAISAASDIRTGTVEFIVQANGTAAQRNMLTSTVASSSSPFAGSQYTATSTSAVNSTAEQQITIIGRVLNTGYSFFNWLGTAELLRQ